MKPLNFFQSGKWISRRITFAFALTTFMLGISLVETAWAGGAVTSCTESDLRTAMTGGGTVTFACDGTITLTNTITITADTILDATGHQVIVSGGGSVRVFFVNTNVSFEAFNLTIADGRSTNGAGILNHGTVNLLRTVLQSNTAYNPFAYPANSSPHDAFGGAVLNYGILNVNNCSFLQNSVVGGDAFPDGHSSGGVGDGGAICNFGVLAVNGSTFSGNTAVGGPGAAGNHGDGGFNWAFVGFPGASGADGNGGALFNSGTATLVNSTFAWNTGTGGAGGPGGDGGNCVHSDEASIGGDGGVGGKGGIGVAGIFDASGLCYMTNCTIAFNYGIEGAGGAGGAGGYGTSPGRVGYAGQNGAAGGGIKTVGAKLLNCLLATNSPNNCFGTMVDIGHNLSSDGSCVFTNVGSMNNTDPKLGPLADNGGPTLTMALLPDSPAINAGAAVGAPTTDQRGVIRPQGPAVDIGAFEYLYNPVFLDAKFYTATFRLQMIGLPNQIHTLQVSSNLLNWCDVTNFVAGTNGICEFIDCDVDKCGVRFYRLKIDAP